jgi:16S rRNA (uracil1498-N3)-methyltransferase
MECFFAEEFDKSFSTINLSIDESKHTKSLRISIDDEILVTNGKGLTALCRLTQFSKQGNILEVQEFYENFNELSVEITLAVGITENTDRYEFIIEKAVELGVTEIVPLITKYTTVSKIRYDRAVAKSIAALKQSKRSVLTGISEPVRFNQIVDKLSYWDCVILADEDGAAKLNISESKKIIILCGPEGGFSADEIIGIKQNQNLQTIKLSKTRLRTETAAISAISAVVFNLL